ncbi:MAG TPA: hypothetical protein VFY45_16155 [Baekduia sp.]|nr:hypothetical protein [Baekduia sp.]
MHRSQLPQRADDRATIGPTMFVSTSPAAALVAFAPVAVLPSPAPPAQGVATQSGTPKRRATPAREAPPASSAQGSDERGPGAPAGPPNQSFFASGSAPPAGGVSSALWCAMLAAALAYAAQELRRHRLRFVVLEPIGFVSPQQRPG